VKKLDRFILKAFIGPFVAILLVVIFILMMQFLWVYIDDLVGKGLGFGVILEFLMWGVFTILNLALPLATLLASMMVIGQLAENNEMQAIKAAGIPLSRVLLPLIYASVVISIGAYAIDDKLVPQAYNKIFTLRDDIGKTKNEIKIPSGTFYDGIEGYILRVEDQNKETGMLYNVMVYDHTGGKGNTSVTLADSSIMRMSKGKDHLTFTLFNGTNYQEDNTVKYNDTSLVLQHVAFARQDLLIPLNNYSFEKSDTSRFGDQPKSLTVKQLRHQSDSLHRNVDSIGVANYATVRAMPIFLESKQLDTALRNSDREFFADDSLCIWPSSRATTDAYRKAYDNASKFASEVNRLKYDVYEQNYYIRHIDIELLRTFAQALACLIFFFIGAPLGALIRKGGLGASAIISVLFFLLYWVIDISGTKLATDGAVSALIGAFISAAILIPIGAFLTWKAINDSEFFNMDQFKSKWRKLKSKIERLFRPTRIVYMGTPEFAVAPLDALIKSKYKIVGVVSVADKPAGRGQKVSRSAVARYADEHGIPVLQPLKLKDPEFLSALKAWKADLFVVVAFRMLPEEVWSMPRLGTVNLHAALLPQYRGAAPINWALINGEKITGVTTFMIDKNIDTGGIILREEVRITPEDNAGTLHDKLMEKGSLLVLQTVEGLIQHNIELRTQRSFIQGSEALKPAPKISRELCHIDWSDNATAILNLIRGLSPYPAAFTEIVPLSPADAKAATAAPLALKIFEAEVISVPEEYKTATSTTAGSILSDGKTLLAIVCGDGSKALKIKDLQLSGKKRMAATEFLRGFREPEKYHCTQGTSKEIITQLCYAKQE